MTNTSGDDMPVCKNTVTWDSSMQKRQEKILTFGETFRENTFDHTGFTSIGPSPFFADQFSSMSKITSKLKICIFYGGALTP
jgi:hypothetical protein